MSPITITHPADRLARRDLLMFDVMHQAMRSQSRALVLALEWFGDLEVAGATQLRDWYHNMLETIEHHHTVEDTIFFPMMVAHDERAAALGDRMASDHHVLDERLHAVRDALEAMVAAASDPVAVAQMPAGYAASVVADAQRAAQDLVDCLDDHLGREEAKTFPIFLASVPRSTFEAGHQQAMEQGDKALMAYVFAWGMPSATAAQVAQLMETVPRIGRAVFRFVWKPRYEKAYPRMVAAQREVLAAGSWGGPTLEVELADVAARVAA